MRIRAARHATLFLMSLPMFAQGPSVIAPGAGADGKSLLRSITSYPVLTRKVEPAYTAEARAMRLEGTVSLFAEVNVDGTTSGVRLMHGLGLGLDEAAIAAVKQWRYRPAIKDGIPAKMLQLVDVDFTLGTAGRWRFVVGAFTAKGGTPRRSLEKPVLSAYVAPPACEDGRSTMVRLQVSKDGTPRDIKLEGPRDASGLAVLNAAKSWRYKPGSVDGKPRDFAAVIELACGPRFVLDSLVFLIAPPGVTPPVPTYKPEPEYSIEARNAKLQGEVGLAVIVDETGRVPDIYVIKPFGYGLDEQAIEAVKQWRFKPGTKDGGPVNVQATVAVAFHLL
jgi:TonB family protein